MLYFRTMLSLFNTGKVQTLVIVALLVTPLPTHAQNKSQTSPEKKTARYMESVRNQPSLLEEFLRRMPKGGDLHNHLSGAVYAESFIRWAVQDGLCVDTIIATFVPPPCDPAKDRQPANSAYRDAGLYSSLLDAFSMRGWMPARESGHDHFFATFGKFGAATNGHTADMIVEVRSRYANENI